METENSPTLPKHKTQRNKSLNNSDPELNRERQDNTVEQPFDQSQ